MNTITTRKSCVLLAAAAGLALAAVLGLGALHAAAAPLAESASELAPLEPDPATGRSGSPRIPADREAQAGVYTAPVGRRIEYSLQAETSYRLGARDGDRQPAVEVRADGTLSLQVVARPAEGIVVALRLRDLVWTVARRRLAAGDPSWTAQEAAAASRVLVHLGADGAVRGYGFAAALDGDQRNFLRGLLAPLCFTVPLAGGTTWEATEADATGVYRARYRILPDEDRDQRSVAREKVRYTELARDAEGLPEHVLNGVATAGFSASLGWLARADIDERCQLQLACFQMRVELEQHYVLRLRGAADAAVAAEDLAAETVLAPAAGHREEVGAAGFAEHQRRLDAAAAALDLDTVLDRLRVLLRAEPADREALTSAWHDLASLARVKDTVVAELRARLESGELNGELGASVLTAFGAAGTGAAQEALGAARCNAALPDSLREAACVAMLQLAAPRAGLVTELVADLRAAATFAGLDGTGLRLLGAMASRSDAALADGLSAFGQLRGLEDKARRTGTTAAWLDALGNSGRPEALADAVRYTTDTDPDVRAAAFSALRRIPGEQAVHALVDRGLRDADPGARTEAVAALGLRSEAAAAAALRRAVREDADGGVRRAAVGVLARSAAPGSANHAALTEVASSDPLPELREFARRCLAGRG